MGLAASQGRYLCLTARNSDLVYEGQQISQQRLALTNETQEVADKYNEAMNNKIMQANTADGVTQQLTYDILTSQNPYSGLGMRLVDVNGNVVIPGEYIEVSSKEQQEATDGEESLSENYNSPKKYTSKDDFIQKYFSDVTGYNLTELRSMSLNDLCNYYNEQNPDSEWNVVYKDKTSSELVGEGEHVVKDANCMDPLYLQEMLTTGQWLLQQANPNEESGWDNMTWQGSSLISEVYYTVDDAAAEAEYEAAMTKIQKQDKLLELRLEQVQTQQSSVEKEMESVKQIIDKNIEDSFKTFA
ncbi:TPA: hypothetical protein IAA87_01515 [Candidatus Avigastranaerophilus faecigallinarum]|nr:hypothetical protein [Candidatus Avigastranaerophilus faecigallinarum]